MKRKRYSEEQIAFALRQAESGGSVRGCGGNCGFDRGVGLGWPSELAARVELRSSHP